MIRKLGIFALTLYACTALAQAAPAPLVWCNGCTEAQKADKARVQPLGPAYVGDLIQRTVDAYDVYMDVNDGYSPPRREKRAERTPIDASHAAVGTALIDFYYSGTSGWAKHDTVSYPDGARNVYDAAINSPAQGAMLDWIATQQWSGTAGVRFINLFAIFQIVDANAVPIQEVMITFWDGSKIVVALDYSTTTDRFKVVDDSGRDSHGNIVLSVASDRPIRFEFPGLGNPNDPRNWHRHMSLLGYAGSGASGGIWACTKSAAGRHCSRMP